MFVASISIPDVGRMELTLWPDWCNFCKGYGFYTKHFYKYEIYIEECNVLIHQYCVIVERYLSHSSFCKIKKSHSLEESGMKILYLFHVKYYCHHLCIHIVRSHCLFTGEGYHITSLLCPVPFHVRWNKICLNQYCVFRYRDANVRGSFINEQPPGGSQSSLASSQGSHTAAAIPFADLEHSSRGTLEGEAAEQEIESGRYGWVLPIVSRLRLGIVIIKQEYSESADIWQGSSLPHILPRFAIWRVSIVF